MEEEDIVIVGAGIAGLATSLGLHRLGLKSKVLESSQDLRSTGFALTLWANAWRALDALGIGDSLRQHSLQILGFRVASADSGLVTSEISLDTVAKYGENYESRCVKRKELLQPFVEALPHGTIRYSSKVVSIEESGRFKLVHLSDGSILKTKVLIGCDGVNSVVAKFLGLQTPVSSGRSAIRGLVEFPSGHNFEPKINFYLGRGVRFGVLPCDDKALYWFCTFTPPVVQCDENVEKEPSKMKQFVLSKICNIPREALEVVERTELNCISCASLKLRLPWNVLMGDIVDRNVCVVGDALHPMTPDLGQGGCSALEDSIVLARCLGQALLKKPRLSENTREDDGEEEYDRIKEGIEKYGRERRWRSFSLISTAYVVGFIQQSEGKVMSFLRERWLSKYTPEIMLRMADINCGQLQISD